MSSKITNFFSKESINELARETGFVKRERTVSGFCFAETLLFSKFDHSKLSLEELAESFTKNAKKVISKQAIDQRFTPETVEFFKRLIQKALQEILIENDYFNFLCPFKEVRVKDSTSFQLPEEMKDAYPGSGGDGSEACIRIQFEYDLKSGRVIDLSIGPYNTQDSTDALAKLSNIVPDVLILRDLGYISIEALEGIQERGGFFINRLRGRSSVYELIEGKYHELNFEKVYQFMKKNSLNRIEKDVFITSKYFGVRMIIEIMPEEIANERIRKAAKEAKKKGRALSKEYKIKAHFNIFITNIEDQLLPSSQIVQTYTLRWQIELVFKIWKSIGEINKVKKMKKERFESYLYAKLLWLMINWQMLWQINKYMYRTEKKLLSFYKAYNSLKNSLIEFKMALREGGEDIMCFILEQAEMGRKFHVLDKKKDKNTLYELVELK